MSSYASWTDIRARHRRRTSRRRTAARPRHEQIHGSKSTKPCSTTCFNALANPRWPAVAAQSKHRVLLRSSPTASSEVRQFPLARVAVAVERFCESMLHPHVSAEPKRPTTATALVRRMTDRDTTPHPRAIKVPLTPQSYRQSHRSETVCHHHQRPQF